MKTQRSWWVMLTLLVIVLVGISACSQPTPAAPPAAEKATAAPAPTEAAAPTAAATEEAATEKEAAATEESSASASGATVVKLWTHNGGNPEELSVVEDITKKYNESQDKYVVEIEAYPQAAYNDTIAAAAVAKNLPCILDTDGPITPNFAWAGYLQPLKLDKAVEDSIAASAKSYYKGDLYSVGLYDAALSIMTRKSILEENKIRIPTMEQPWTLEEFDGALVKLQETGKYDYPIDIKTAYAAEWWPYAYAPWLQSFGGDLIDRDTMLSAEGKLNGPEAVKWGKWFQSLFTRKLADPNAADDQAFIQGRAALEWNGNWNARTNVEKYGDDMLFLPAPDFGKGPVIGGASWQWAISASCDQPEGALGWINLALTPEYVAKMANTLGNIPVTEEGAKLSENFGPEGKFRVFYEFSQKYALIRPPTPGYLTMSSIFDKAARDIANGADVQTTLDNAVDEIDRNIADNKGYGFSE
jgi:multiple sugar transport system substrate-binding protein